MYKKELKEKLLKTCLVNNNIFLDNYVDLIINNKNTTAEKFKTNSHHIIPRCYYEHNELPVDNHSSNKVNLYIKDHLLAHYYLYKCAKEDWFKLSNLQAIKFSKNYSHNKEDISDEWVSENLECISKLWSENNRLQSENARDISGNKNPFYGKHHTSESKKKISIAKTNPSESTREKLSLSHLNKKQSKETIEKRKESLRLAHKNSKNNGFANVGEKISATKRKCNSGNNRKGKIHIENTTTGETKYILPEYYNQYVLLGYSKFLTKREKAKLTKKPRPHKKIICLNTNQIFDNITEVSKYFNIAESSIRKVCLGAYKSVHGYDFKYYNKLGD